MSRARQVANLSPTIADARMPNLTGDVTTVEGAVATTIATDAVDIAMLSATGTASSSTFLRGDNAWEGVAGAVHVGQLSPNAHSTASNGSETIDLSEHDNLHASWNDYITESGATVTIVKAGLYLFDCRALCQTNAENEINLYVVATGYDTVNDRVHVTTSNAIWNSVHVVGLFQLTAGNTVVQTVTNNNVSSYHHHAGPSWTRMSISFLG